MAITITTDLADNVAAFAPCVVEGTTDRYPFDSTGTRQSNAIISLTDSGATLLRIEIISNADYLVGDTIDISGATGDYAQYNGRHAIGSLSGSTYIITTTAWVSATTGDEGTVTRRNDNLYIKAEVSNNTPEVIATLYEQVGAGGTFSFDFRQALQSELATAFSLTAGEGNPGSLSHNYTIAYYETFQMPDYSTTDKLTAATTSTIAHRTTAYDTDNVSGTELLTGAMYGKDKVVFHFMTDKTSDVRIRIVTNAGYTTTTAITTIIRQHAIITFDWPAQSDVLLTAAPYFYLDVQWNGITGAWTSIKTPILFKLITGCHSTQLYYVNRLGGYESYKFTSYDDTQRTVKVDKYTAEAWQERTLEGQVYPRGTFQTIRDVITSPEVYDEDGTLVEVLSDSLNYRSEEVSPFVTIRYDETFIQ